MGARRCLSALADTVRPSRLSQLHWCVQQTVQLSAKVDGYFREHER